jgi:hypothetical protein
LVGPAQGDWGLDGPLCGYTAGNARTSCTPGWRPRATLPVTEIAARVDCDAWRDLPRKESDEQRELAQRLALAAPIPAPEPRRPWWKRLAG